MKLAVIGASVSQRPIFIEARKMGIETIAFAWEQGAPFKLLADKFYPISITEHDEILKICQAEKVDGILSNGSDLAARITARLADDLNLNGTPSSAIDQIGNKWFVREHTKEIEGLCQLNFSVYGDEHEIHFPCVVKPFVGGGKHGVSYVEYASQFDQAIEYAQCSQGILVEEFVEGNEVSIESISYHGQTTVVQITDKMSSGAPHFVELGHSQPSCLPNLIKEKICRVVPEILSRIGFTDGATHTEMKITPNGDLYLIEVNPRGGGDEISATLVDLSTDFGYVKSMVEVALNIYTPRIPKNIAYSGIRYVCAWTKEWLPIFETAEENSWFVRKGVVTNMDALTVSKNQRDRNAFFIYCTEHDPDFKR